MQEAGVQNVTVKTTTFRGTQNGLRIKTWARPSNGFVKGVLFQHSVMVNARYPILIDQEYCPDQKNCPGQVQLRASVGNLICIYIHKAVITHIRFFN